MWTEYSIPFPRLTLHPSSGANTVSLSQVFRGNDDVTVIEGQDEIVRIFVGDVPDAILKAETRILKLDEAGQYSPTLAVFEITQNEGVRAAGHRLNVQQFVRVPLDVGYPEPQKRLPHLPAVLERATVDQALDAVARTFGGVVVYGACPREGVFDINYFGDLAGLR
jgi:hypothetical protein